MSRYTLVRYRSTTGRMLVESATCNECGEHFGDVAGVRYHLETEHPPFTWASVSQDDQRKLLDIIGGDGHAIWSADALIRDGVPAFVVDTFTRVERAGNDWKSSIHTSQGTVSELRGVYGLTVIRSLASYYHEESHKFGRGSEARELTEKILTHLTTESAA